MRSRTVLFVVFALVTVAAIGWGATRQVGSDAEPSPAFVAAGSDVEPTSRAIAFYEARIVDDPRAAADRANLAGLYLQRSRSTGDFGDVLRAEELARQSLAVRTKLNGKAFRMLAASLLSQHRFAEAREVARELVRIWPEDTPNRAMLAEIQMELGDYDAAKITFASLQSVQNQLTVAPRLSRWALVRGQTTEALRLMRAARDQAVARGEFSREELSWYYLRVGDVEMQRGDLRQAAKEYRAGLAVAPEDYRLLAAMARLEANRNQWKQAIEYGERAIAAVLDPGTLGVLSDAYAAVGDSAQADEYARVMQVAIRNQAGSFHRDWSLFLLDHGRSVDQVSTAAARDVLTRRDVYGYDLLAWALYKQGRNAEAREAAVMALRMGTRDALLLYHAGMIERAAGDDRAAKAYLREALEINPQFHPTHPATARAVLDSIGGRSWRLPFRL